MSPQLFILAITCYLVSMVAALVASFVVKQISPKLVYTLITCHFLLFICWILNRNAYDSVELPGSSNYLFLAFFCTGIINAGILIRSKYSLALKSYFAIYLLSLAIFLVSPSRVLGFIASGNLKSVNPTRYHVLDNYYLVEQQNSSLPGEKKSFKLIREMGMFHNTLTRDIALPSTTDSVNCLVPPDGDNFNIRVYFKIASGNDSLDMEIKKDNHRDQSGEIQQKRKL